MELYAALAIHALAFGLVLFLVASGLSLAFGFMGVLSFAHGAFYALGAYLGLAVAQRTGPAGFWIALVAAPLGVGLLGAAVELAILRRVRARGHMPELLATFAVGWIVVEAVQWVWGAGPREGYAPSTLAGTVELAGVRISTLRLVACAIAAGVLVALAVALHASRLGLVLRAARDRPTMVEGVGIALPRWHAAAFGASAALAALAGVIGGNLFVIEPAMASQVAMLAFVVVVVGGLGSLRGTFAAALAVAALATVAAALPGAWLGAPLARWAQAAPLALMVVVLLRRPHGWFVRA